ncbi:acetate kinase [Fulvivirgaceae bacterium BMA12]|uniref:Acetate kinase n=1 Tax=Agaribacillus aureus TaxID=3051825 RepID=A0ABT8LBM7_9BACT|nr:acetate kinase [Fulvivirgaceae bacterium BMA12]
MRILVINSGSSSIKFQLIVMPSAEAICEGMVERVGLEDAKIHFHSAQKEFEKVIPVRDHKEGLKTIASYLMDPDFGVVKSADEIDVVGHRVVHGGSTFSGTTVINEAVKDKIRALFALAPLHNPPNLEGILVSEEVFPDAKQIAVFDTAFHQTIPVEAFKYAIPNRFLDEDGIRVYGFHGTSHKYVSERAMEYLGRTSSKIITIHLGNGCSMTAIKDGQSIDHTLGFSPMNGLIMGTRSGDIDASIIFYLVNSLGYSLDEVNRILQKESGMLGLTGYSDLRDIQREAQDGNNTCQLALKMYAYRIQKFIGAYAAAMNGLDAIVFTAGVGENSDVLRSLVCENMDFLGISIDQQKNEVRSGELREINTISSKVKVLIIPTNEELEIARQAFDLME